MAFFVDRTFYKSNANNLAIAVTNSGVGTPTQQISVPTQLTGTISTNTGNTGVTGVSSLFLTQVDAGDYLYSSTDNYIGRVSSITNDTLLTLESGGAYETLTGADYKYSPPTGASISGDILMRVGVLYVSPTSVNIPKISELRDPNGALTTYYTDENYISLQKVSTSGTPGTEIAAVDVPMTIERLNVFTQASLPTGNYFPTSSDLPTYIWYKLNPYGALSSTLDVNTRYYFLCAEDLPEIAITTSMTYSEVNNGNY